MMLMVCRPPTRPHSHASGGGDRGRMMHSSSSCSRATSTTSRRHGTNTSVTGMIQIARSSSSISISRAARLQELLWPDLHGHGANDGRPLPLPPLLACWTSVAPLPCSSRESCLLGYITSVSFWHTSIIWASWMLIDILIAGGG
jgi:hypothetical protein